MTSNGTEYSKSTVVNPQGFRTTIHVCGNQIFQHQLMSAIAFGFVDESKKESIAQSGEFEILDNDNSGKNIYKRLD